MPRCIDCEHCEDLQNGTFEITCDEEVNNIDYITAAADGECDTYTLNNRLAEAAPELLDACKASLLLLDFMRQGFMRQGFPVKELKRMQTFRYELKSVIAKAEGREADAT